MAAAGFDPRTLGNNGKAAILRTGVGNELSPAPRSLCEELDPERDLPASPGPFQHKGDAKRKSPHSSPPDLKAGPLPKGRSGHPFDAPAGSVLPALALKSPDAVRFSFMVGSMHPARNAGVNERDRSTLIMEGGLDLIPGRLETTRKLLYWNWSGERAFARPPFLI